MSELCKTVSARLSKIFLLCWFGVSPQEATKQTVNQRKQPIYLLTFSISLSPDERAKRRHKRKQETITRLKTGHGKTTPQESEKQAEGKIKTRGNTHPRAEASVVPPRRAQSKPREKHPGLA